MGVVGQVERRVLQGILGLPRPVQQVIAGRPLRREGQTLATDVQTTLRLMRLKREPELGSVPVAESRRLLRRQTLLAGGAQPIGAVHEVPVGERAGRLYVPRGASSPGPMLVWFHGGGFVYGDLDTHDAACRFLSERSGVRVLAVDYRLAPEAPFPAAHDDCEASYRWVVEHAASLGADPSRLAVGGDSAGGTLAAAVAIAAARDGLPLAFQLLIYPATDWGGETASRRLYNRRLVLTQEFLDAAHTGYLQGEDEELDPRVSPLLAELPEGLAPAYVATAGFDPLRDEGEAYARKLAAAGVPLEMHRFADQIHGFIHMVGVGRSGRAAMSEIAERLRAGLDEDGRS